MKSKFITLIVVLSSLSTAVLSQSDQSVSQKTLIGIAELRKDILTREQNYLFKVKRILEEIDTASISSKTKEILILYIRKDFANGALGQSTESFNALPEKSPFKSPYIARYVQGNEDYAIDKAFIKELRQEGIFKKDALKIADVTPLINELDLINIQENERILHAHAANGLFDMLIGYIYEGIDITVHNKFTDLHYTALDRMDRYPNVNNGNVIEFLNITKNAIDLEGEQWDKIIIRDALFFENELPAVLKSVHDNLTPDGHVYVKVDTKSSDKCKVGPKKEKLIKGFLRQEYEVLLSQDFGCKTMFKLKSVKEIN